MTKRIPTLPDFSLLVQNPIHAPHRAKIGPFIEQGGIDLPGRLIDKPIRVQEIQNLLPLFRRQGPRGNCPLPLRGGGGWGWLPSVITGSGQTQRLAGLLDSDLLGERDRRLHPLFSPFGSEDRWRISEMFFCTSMRVSACFS